MSKHIHGPQKAVPLSNAFAYPPRRGVHVSGGHSYISVIGDWQALAVILPLMHSRTCAARFWRSACRDAQPGV